jgi:hypothetical protein
VRLTLLPLVAWGLCDDHLADQLLVAWGHYLGSCDRPYGRQSFALTLAGEVVGVAVSASTVSATVAGYQRQEVVELARLCAHPEHRDLTRVALRLWRILAPGEWPYWPVRALVSYSDSSRHKGNIYRADGWTRVAETKGSSGGGTWSTKKEATSKTLWKWIVEDKHHAGTL